MKKRVIEILLDLGKDLIMDEDEVTDHIKAVRGAKRFKDLFEYASDQNFFFDHSHYFGKWFGIDHKITYIRYPNDHWEPVEESDADYIDRVEDIINKSEAIPKDAMERGGDIFDI